MAGSQIPLKEIPLAVVPPDFESVYEQCLLETGLLSSRTSLRSLGPNVHWHIKLPGKKGTLELTWLSNENRAWFSIHANRDADWIDAVILRLTQRLTQDTTE